MRHSVVVVVVVVLLYKVSLPAVLSYHRQNLVTSKQLCYVTSKWLVILVSFESIHAVFVRSVCRMFGVNWKIFVNFTIPTQSS